MDLSRNVIKRFVEVTAPVKVTSNDITVYGTITGEGDELYVKIDGSDVLTPITSTIDVREGDRVLVMIKNREAMVIGAPTSATARLEKLKELEGEVTKFGVVMADKLGVGELVAMQALLEHVEAKDVVITGRLDVNEANIEDLTAENVEIKGEITAYKADIEEIKTKKLDADSADIKYATIEKLDVVEADVKKITADYGEYKELSADKFSTIEGVIETLDTEKLSADQADIKYANIDFSNIGKAAIEYFYTKSGMIENVVIGDATIAGSVCGVTLKGDLIEGNTIKADKLVIKGNDGIYYKLNFEGGTFADGEAVPTDTLHGSVITANSITAEKIGVQDLVAFGATIGGFEIDDDAIHSFGKDSATNTVRGIYMDKSGQLAIGDQNNFIKLYEDQNGVYRLEISAASITLGASGKNLEETIDDIQVGARNLIRRSTNLLFSEYYFTGPIKASHDGTGKVTLVNGASASSDLAGNVILHAAVSVNDDGAGNVTIV